MLCGSVSKIYKSKTKGQFVVYLPSELINALGLREGDEIDFFKHPDNNKYFIVAKKSDIASLIMARPQAQRAQAQQSQARTGSGLDITEEELAVLKKLDSIRYSDRTKDRLRQALNPNERKVLVGLVKKKYVSPFKKAGEQTFKYGIAKSVYEKFLYGKRERARQQQQTVTIQIPQVNVRPIQEPKKWEKNLEAQNTYLDALEQNGFLVINNQTEASSVAAQLEESIRTGHVIGTRAFNKRYYIALKVFVAKNAARVLKAIGTKNTGVSEISKVTGIDEEGCRAILYIMAENGEVAEARRDIFRIV